MLDDRLQLHVQRVLSFWAEWELQGYLFQRALSQLGVSWGVVYVVKPVVVEQVSDYRQV